MSTIIRKTTTGYECDQNGTITTNLKVVFDKRKGCGDIKLPEGCPRKWLSESRFVNGITEIDLDNMPQRATNASGTTGTTKTAVPKLNWEDFVTEEDQELLKAIKDRAQKRMAVSQTEAKIKAMEEEIARLRAAMLGETEVAEATEETEETEEA